MKIDFSQKILDVKGEDTNSTLADAAFRALNAINPAAREPLSLAEMQKRGELANRVIKGGEQEISPEDATLIRNLLPLVCQPSLGVIVADMLTGD